MNLVNKPRCDVERTPIRRKQNPLSTLCADHGGNRFPGCSDYQRAQEASIFWTELEEAAGLEFPEWSNKRAAFRQGIGSTIDRFHAAGLPSAQPKTRGAPPKLACDELIASLAVHYRSATGKHPEARGRNDARDDRPLRPGFVKFLWTLVPKLPDLLPIASSPLTLQRRARDVLANARGPEGRVRGKELVRLRVVAAVKLQGQEPGAVFVVPAEGGLPVALYWQRRLAEGAVLVVRRIFVPAKRK